MPILKIYAADRPEAALVLAHGAGAGQSSAWMVKAAQALADRGVTTATFDFPYITAGRKAPDRAPVLEAHWREVIARGEEETARAPALHRRQVDGRPHLVTHCGPG